MLALHDRRADERLRAANRQSLPFLLGGMPTLLGRTLELEKSFRLKDRTLHPVVPSGLPGKRHHFLALARLFVQGQVLGLRIDLGRNGSRLTRFERTLANATQAGLQRSLQPRVLAVDPLRHALRPPAAASGLTRQRRRLDAEALLEEVWVAQSQFRRQRRAFLR